VYINIYLIRVYLMNYITYAHIERLIKFIRYFVLIVLKAELMSELNQLFESKLIRSNIIASVFVLLKCFCKK